MRQPSAHRDHIDGFLVPKFEHPARSLDFASHRLVRIAIEVGQELGPHGMLPGVAAKQDLFPPALNTVGKRVCIILSQASSSASPRNFPTSFSVGSLCSCIPSISNMISCFCKLEEAELQPHCAVAGQKWVWRPPAAQIGCRVRRGLWNALRFSYAAPGSRAVSQSALLLGVACRLVCMSLSLIASRTRRHETRCERLSPLDSATGAAS